MKEEDVWESFDATEEVKTVLRSGIPTHRLKPLAQEYKDIEGLVMRNSERLKELAEQMAQMFPEYVTRSLSIDKRKFQKLPPETQELIKFALTRKLDKAKVKVVENV